MLRLRMFLIAAGYEDADDCDAMIASLMIILRIIAFPADRADHTGYDAGVTTTVPTIPSFSWCLQK